MTKGKFGVTFNEKTPEKKISNDRSLIVLACDCKDFDGTTKSYGDINNAIIDQSKGTSENPVSVEYLRIMQSQGSKEVILANTCSKDGETNVLTDTRLAEILEKLEDAVFNVLIVPYELSDTQIDLLNEFYETKKRQAEIIGLYTIITPTDDGSNLKEFSSKFPATEHTSLLHGALTTPLSMNNTFLSLGATCVTVASNIANSDENSKVSYRLLTGFDGASTRRFYNNNVYESCLENSCIAFEYLDSVTGKLVISNANTPSNDDLKIIRVYGAIFNALRVRIQDYCIGEDNNMITKQNLEIAIALVRQEFLSRGWINELTSTVSSGGNVSCEVDIISEHNNVLKNVNVFSEIEVL